MTAPMTSPNVFRELAEGAGLLGEAIHEIQLLWTGPDELKEANYALQSMPKGLRFLRAEPATESPKVMGVMGIHDPDALWHFAGYTYCPWCGKEGQNEGTVVNHLRTTHYRLGLVCNQCFGFPTVMLDTLQPAWMPKLSKISCHIWIRPIHLTYPFNQEFPQRSKGGDIQPDPLHPGRPEGFNGGGTAHQSAKSIFCSLVLPTNRYFYPSCNQDCL